MVVNITIIIIMIALFLFENKRNYVTTYVLGITVTHCNSINN